MKIVLALSIPVMMLAGAALAVSPGAGVSAAAPAQSAAPTTAPSGHKDRITWPCPQGVATS